MDTFALQRALIAHGYGVGSAGADGKPGPATKRAVEAFQRDRGLHVDGIAGPATIAALGLVTAAPVPSHAGQIVPADWMPPARLERVICHWTAGQHRASTVDRAHYHILIEGDAKLIRGAPSIAANGIGGSGRRAEHTLNCNTGSIGVSLCCMIGAVESPFSAGPAPMTAAQWAQLARVVADLCRRYAIPVSPRTVLSHAEVQGTLGIKQRGKWDFTRLAFDPTVRGAKACGDLLRAATAALI